MGRLCFSTILRALSLRPDIFVIDECGCSKSQDIAIPMMALGKKLTRMVLAGDLRQLPPLIFTKLTQKIWGESILAQLRGRGHPTTRINIEYRCRSDLDYPSTTSNMVPTGQQHYSWRHNRSDVLYIYTPISLESMYPEGIEEIP